MSDLVPKALGFEIPIAFFSGPSFARELLDSQPSAGWFLLYGNNQVISIRNMTQFAN